MIHVHPTDRAVLVLISSKVNGTSCECPCFFASPSGTHSYKRTWCTGTWLQYPDFRDSLMECWFPGLMAEIQWSNSSILVHILFLVKKAVCLETRFYIFNMSHAITEFCSLQEQTSQCEISRTYELLVLLSTQRCSHCITGIINALPIFSLPRVMCLFL